MKDLLPDLFDAHQDSLSLLPGPFQSYGGCQLISAPIQTVRCYRDNSKVAETLAQDGKGRVLLVDGQGTADRSLLGDNLAEKAIRNGWVGVVVLGPVRDVATLSDMPLAVFALGACPIKTNKRGVGEVAVPLVLAGVTIEPGHYLYADLNGVAVSSQAF